ncbi:MAG: 50S ribosomal protein L28 [Candidatus Peregrinibacteria bacterium GW2011_GWF2_38_29]|nr:MAG: 50S ribosomal protein L28 [Candidatus Peregrinibacteria bacterium GW2011_GWF2_38_29]HBB02397.1 50S ribosomal protein L28 [Candidatus Peregrinibacteria bacterium]
MAKECAVTGKSVQVGRRVSHSNRKTLRRFSPALTVKRVFNKTTGKFEKMMLSNKGLKTLTKRMK